MQNEPHLDTNAEILEDVDDDPVTKAISKTGCLHLHYAVQECMAEKQDWRKCQDDLIKFRKCIEVGQGCGCEEER